MAGYMPHTMPDPDMAADGYMPDISDTMATVGYTPDMMVTDDNDASMDTSTPTAGPNSATGITQQTLPLRYPHPVANDDFNSPNIPSLVLTQAPTTRSTTLTQATPTIPGLGLLQQPKDITQQPKDVTHPLLQQLSTLAQQRSFLRTTAADTSLPPCQCPNPKSHRKPCPHSLPSRTAALLRTSAEHEDAVATAAAFVAATTEVEFKHLLATLPRDAEGVVMVGHVERLAGAGFHLLGNGGWSVRTPSPLQLNEGVVVEASPDDADGYPSPKFRAFEAITALRMASSVPAVRKMLRDKDFLPREEYGGIGGDVVEVLRKGGLTFDAKGEAIQFNPRVVNLPRWVSFAGEWAERQERAGKGKGKKARRERKMAYRLQKGGRGESMDVDAPGDEGNADAEMQNTNGEEAKPGPGPSTGTGRRVARREARKEAMKEAKKEARKEVRMRAAREKWEKKRKEKKEMREAEGLVKGMGALGV